MAFPRSIAVISALSAALWIAICAAAPEFIWQGIWVTVGHFSLADGLAALVIGLTLAFFVEPLIDAIRRLLVHGGEKADKGSRSAGFTVTLSLIFALVSVCLHDAMTAFVTGADGAAGTGLTAAIALTISWAIVPFAVTGAWLSRGHRPLAMVTGACAILSPCLAAWLYEWQVEATISTMIPTLFIVLLGYGRGRSPFVSSASRVAMIAILWLVFALAFNWATHLYTASRFWVDLRFYAGWVLGLLLAPFPAGSSPAAGHACSTQG